MEATASQRQSGAWRRRAPPSSSGLPGPAWRRTSRPCTGTTRRGSRHGLRHGPLGPGGRVRGARRPRAVAVGRRQDLLEGRGLRLALTACGKTPEAPGLPMCLTARGSGDAWKRLCGSVPAGSCRTSVSGRGCPGGAVSPPVPLDGVMMRLCCGQGYVAERSHRPATHGNPPSGRTIVFCGQGGSRKAISPLSSFQGRSGPSSAAPHSAIALAFVPGSIPAWTSVVPGL